MKCRTVTATEFSFRCLALINEIAGSGETIVVTRRGRAVAQLSPFRPKPWKDLAGSWAGKVEIVGNILNYDTSHLWNVHKDEE
ncbi:MAG: type II toxin-antitoxin system Phd/YefM family antitoxin [Bryobacteraceae bacterium]